MGIPGELMVRRRGAASDGRSSGEKVLSPCQKLTLSLNRLSIFVILGALFLSVTTTAHAGRQAQSTNHYSLSEGVSIDLSSDWHKVETGQGRLPAELASYAPPFHFSATLILENVQEGSILQVAISDNPLLGYDSFAFDKQMHSRNESGVSLLDFLFYLFLPPPPACLQEVLANSAIASRVSILDPDSPSDLQISYSCGFSKTLLGFYATQLSSGITFRRGTNGEPRAFGHFSNFYIAPMEHVESPGMTFFVFEAQGLGQITPEMITHFNLPVALDGAQADFFWATGSQTPFPFVFDLAQQDTKIIHLSYASAGIGSNKRSEFMALLHQLHLQ
jgi:hypothetical protein